MPNAISVAPFSGDTFARSLMEASRTSEPTPVEQVDYLARYCGRLGARSVVREDAYIDRHFMDEYATYYSRMLVPPPNSVRRFHLFSTEMDGARLDERLNQALTSHEARDRIGRELSHAYLGFVSVRPVPGVPIGRTVLRKLADEEGAQRDIWATSVYEVHLANLTLEVEGLAFQQQDLAVGACATAALWSALARVARHDGMRAPTPAEVSEAAARHLLPNGRTLPAVSGLTMPQLCEAVRACGFAPELLSATMPEQFVLALHTYLLSGIPVVLGLRSLEGSLGDGHAVTAVGFRTGDPQPLLQTTLAVRSANIEKLYVHDDRLGPYARAYLYPVPWADGLGDALLLKIDSPGGREEAWVIESAMAPVYPKLRLSVRSLFMVAFHLAEAIERVVGPERATDINLELKYERSGAYLADLSGRTDQVGAEFLRTVFLPRWCGIIRWYVGTKPLVEFVCDTTDVLREGTQAWRELIRAVVCRAPEFAANVRTVAETFRAPCLASMPPVDRN